MNVLIILSGSPGEIIFSTSLVRALKTQLDNPFLYFLTSEQGRELLQDNPYLGKLITAGNDKEYRALRTVDFDYILDLDNNAGSFLLAARLRGKVFRLRGRSWQKWLLTKLKINKLIPVHVSDQYLSVAKTLGVKSDGLRPDFIIPFKDEVPDEWLPEPVRKDFVVFCLSVPYATRSLTVDRMIELCDKINKPVILLGDKSDAANGDVIERFFKRSESSSGLEATLLALNKKTTVYNGCGKFNLNQQASLVRQARYVFTYDNDFLAIASAFGKTTFALYGNTVLEFGRYPQNTRFTILENNRLSCRPCSVKGYGKCPLSHFKCMNDLVFDFYLP